MARIICIVGSKGGTGKTTLTHLLAHGLALAGHRAVAAVTDRDRQPLAKEGRLYLPVDARTPEALGRIAEKLARVEGWYGILDGAGNRPDADAALARRADLVLLPFRDSHEDVRTVRADLARLPAALAVPSQWPTNVWQLDVAQRLLDEQLADCAHRRLAPVPAVSASKLLLQVQVPATLPTPVNNAARAFAASVLDALATRPAAR